jgi:hypothetical protein
MARALTAGALVVAGLGAAVTAVAFYIDSRSQWSRVQSLGARADAERPDLATSGSCAGVMSATCSQLLDAGETHTRDSNLATAFGIGGGVLLAAGAATYFLWPRSSAERRVVLVPTVQRSGIGASAVLHF